MSRIKPQYAQHGAECTPKSKGLCWGFAGDFAFTDHISSIKFDKRMGQDLTFLVDLFQIHKKHNPLLPT